MCASVVKENIKKGGWCTCRGCFKAIINYIIYTIYNTNVKYLITFISHLERLLKLYNINMDVFT